MIVFDKSDKEYLDWMKTNPFSFIVNTERRRSTKYFVLHRSGCSHIASTSGLTYGAFTEREYIKIGSSDVASIEKYLKDIKPYFIGITKECKSCTPSSINLLNGVENGDMQVTASVNFENIKVGGRYDRNILASLWGYQGRQAISRGVITPANSNMIILFVTREKQASLTQYNDYISEDYLYWEGEEKGANNHRIINSSISGDTIHLFFRDKHHTDFTYRGIIELESYIENAGAPLQAVFNITGNIDEQTESYTEGVTTPELQTYVPLSQTTRQALVSSRVGQGEYRLNLVKIWNSCSVTGVHLLELLIASHIKPWKVSDNRERLDPYNGLLLTPNLDSLFDKGLISFENDGAIIISKRLTSQTCNILNITSNIRLRQVFKPNIPYLEYHREEVFQG